MSDVRMQDALETMSLMTMFMRAMVQVVRITIPTVNYAIFRRTVTLCKICYQCLYSECLVLHTNLQETRGYVVVQGVDMPRFMAERPQEAP